MTEQRSDERTGGWPLRDTAEFTVPAVRRPPADHREAAQRVADVLNEVREAGFSTSMQDWPECMVTVAAGDTLGTMAVLTVTEGRDGVWTVSQ